MLSGTVTSWIITALSWHEPATEAVPVPLGVPGVCAAEVDASGVEAVEVGGISVGRDRPGLVGGRVEVTNAAGTDVVVCGETVTHEPRLRLTSRMTVQVFFITGGLYFESIKPKLIGSTGFLKEIGKYLASSRLCHSPEGHRDGVNDRRE